MDEHRERLDKRLTPIHLFKLTPGTSCGECGLPTCLAFATQVIVGQADIDACPHLDREATEPFRVRLVEQQRAGIGVKREGFEKALSFLRREAAGCDFRQLAASLGARYAEIEGTPALRLVYLGKSLVATPFDVYWEEGEGISPWEKILVYNYVIGGAVRPSGRWIGMESLPNSVSKVKSLKAHCEGRLARCFSGKMDLLADAASCIGAHRVMEQGEPNLAVEIQVLPRLAVRLLVWDEEPSEQFEARVKFLFDSRVLETLDLESLLFCCEQITERLSSFVGEHEHSHCHS